MRQDRMDEVDRFIERFASTLAAAGFPRMAARVFATLLASESGRLTAAELAERLRASTGAVSGAVRNLVHLRLIRTERDPGTRRYSYVVDGSWYEATVTSNPFRTLLPGIACAVALGAVPVGAAAQPAPSPWVRLSPTPRSISVRQPTSSPSATSPTSQP